jgi:hypothetical protein
MKLHNSNKGQPFSFKRLNPSITIFSFILSTLAQATYLVDRSIAIETESIVTTENVPVVPTSTDTVPTLSALELLRADMSPKIEYLNDVLFILKTNNNLIIQKDYASIRSLLRSEPVASLRYTVLIYF